ncbi:transcriptional regulator [Streptomyces sp. NPDC001717]|uniref:transcriptional regulator n=1 Tax=Streptomyces sp. NPDC001717 TaxID=3364604 RepID=UPI003685D741
MTRDQVAVEMARLGVVLGPHRVKAWEQGARVPSETELFALADVLWCPTPVLMSVRPGTHLDGRPAGRPTRERLAHRIGVELHAYAAADDEHRRSGDERRIQALARALAMTPEHLREIIGRSAELIRLLAQAVEERWRTEVMPLAELAELDERRVEHVLRLLRQEYTQTTELYMGHVMAGSPEARLREIADARVRWLGSLPEHFWQLVGPDDGSPRPRRRTESSAETSADGRAEGQAESRAESRPESREKR